MIYLVISLRLETCLIYLCRPLTLLFAIFCFLKDVQNVAFLLCYQVKTLSLFKVDKLHMHELYLEL